MIKKGLGKGLGALIASNENDNEESGVRELKINEIEPNLNQPRKKFDDEKLNQLADSIRQHGIVQPIIVKREGETYKIVAGERRWRAARLAGLQSVPVIIKELSNQEVMEIALIENIQREDLNPIEEAEAYERLLKEYQMTQEELSKAVGKSRSAIANFIRLINLDDRVKQLVMHGEISSGHARALLGIEKGDIQNQAAKEIIEKNLNVRETEKLVKKYLDQREKKVNREEDLEEFHTIEEKLKNIFGTKVKLFNKNRKGKIMIEYYSYEELDRIIDMVSTICKK